MEYLRNNNSDLIVLTSPPRSGKPPRFTLSVEQLGEFNEKAPADTSSRLPYPPDSSCSAAQSSAQWTPYSYHDSDLVAAHSYPLSPPSPRSSQFIRPLSSHRTTSYSPCPRCPALVSVLRPWAPLIMYAISSLTFVIAIAFYKTELFQFLDELALWLRSDDNYGPAVLFFLIFLTTFPPVPLYSTLIVLSGYTFGALIGAIISYFAALTGAVVVFLLSRSLLRDSIDRWLNSLTSVRRVIRAIEKRPKLLFLIRLAPYPYNVMNCLLAASPTLTLRTYTSCTALSLFKVIIHTYIGASIHSFKDYHVTKSSSNEDGNTDRMAEFWTIFGIGLCLFILIYLSIVARKAIDEELDDAPITARDTEETHAFLSGADSDLESARSMTEISSGTLGKPPS